MAKTSKQIQPLEGYQELLRDIKDILNKGRYQAYKAIDNIRVQTYWQIGERIVREELKHKDRADYGKRIVENLATDLNLDRRLMFRIVRFYNLYQIVATVSPQLSWSHYVELIGIEDRKQREFYQYQAIKNNWSVRELRNKIKNKLYESLPVEEKTIISETPLSPVKPEEVFRDVYDFDFLQLPEKYSEKQLEDELLKRFEEVLHELGPDFYIGARQRKIRIDSNIHTIDLELYHRGLMCIVLVDLKIGKLDSRDIGQMNKYVDRKIELTP